MCMKKLILGINLAYLQRLKATKAKKKMVDTSASVCL